MDEGIDIAAPLRAHLQSYSTFTSLVNSTLKDVNQIQSELDTDNKPLPIVRGRLERAYEAVGDQAVDEIRRIDEALQSIDVLLDQLPLPSPVDYAPNPTSPSADNSGLSNGANAIKRGPYKKRQRVGDSAGGDASSSGSPLYSPTVPLPATFPSPTLSAYSNKSTNISSAQITATAPASIVPLTFVRPPSTSPPSGMGLGAIPTVLSNLLASTSVSAYPAPNQSPPPSSSSSSTMPSAMPSIAASMATATTKKPTLKSRREALANQLPLKSGRQVAFRQPKKTVADASKEEWILARIESCMGGDKNKYMVFDVDYDPTNPTPEAGRFATTLKSIVPLPDPRDRKATYPEDEYSKGTQVMALYPDTTSFYSAKIVAGPLSDKGKKKDKVYHVVFDEDGGKIEPVPIELVVEIPT